MEKSMILKLKNKGLTQFQIQVLIATSCIPKGSVRTYKQIAKEAGSPNAYRAVGTALRLNPFPIKIPCHRVVKSNGDPGKYSGKSGTRKLVLLKKEGIEVLNGKIIQK